MKAITVQPHTPGSSSLDDIPEPDPRDGSVLVEAIAVGVCGTDVEIVEGKYGWAPPGKARLVLGHESLGRVIDPGPTGAFREGDLVVGIVRRPDPVPCPNCAVGEWDMCRNGQYTERGIKEIDGFMSERWRIEPEYAMKVDPSLGLLGVLLEPTTVVTKAWEQVLTIGQRAFWEPHTVLVTGAGPIGLLAALVGKQHGLEVHVLDRVESGAKPDLVRALGATYHTGRAADVGFQPDVIVECTGVGQVIADSVNIVGAGGIVCLTGVGTRRPDGRLLHRRRRRDDGAAEQRHRRERQRQQATLVQGGTGPGSRGCHVAGAPRVAAREAGGVHERVAPPAGRHQGRHPVRRSLTGAISAEPPQPAARETGDRQEPASLHDRRAPRRRSGTASAGAAASPMTSRCARPSGSTGAAGCGRTPSRAR